MRRLSVLLVALVLGCVPNYSGLSAPPDPENMVPLDAPEPVTWHTAIQVLAADDLPIEDLQRQFGWIETQVKSVDRTAATAWADCSDPLQNSIPGPDRVAVVVRVKADGSNKSELHVTAGWSYSFDSDVTCQSKGIWEEALLVQIKNAAEAAARSLAQE